MAFHLPLPNQSPISSTTMRSIASHTIHLLVSTCLLLSLVIPITKAQPPYDSCILGFNYTKGSQFQSNLNITLTSFPSKIDSNSNGYYTASSGSNPDDVYALLQCRGDVSTEDCQTCAAKSASELPKKCPTQREAVIFYDECLLHYADHQFFSNENTQPLLGVPSGEESSDPMLFRRQMGILMDNLSSTAVSIPSKFAIGKTRFSDSEDIYGLVQCTRDMSGDSCSRCLQGMIGGISRCCDRKESGWVMSASCYVRYDTRSFFKSSMEAPVVTSPAPTASVDGNSTSPDGAGKTGNTKTIIIAIVIPTVVASVLTSSICLRRKFVRRRFAANKEGIEGTESIVFDLGILKNATNNFAESGKLGQGGFGAVYKGRLPDGQEIAVKRLSQKSNQGLEEMKTEVVLVVKLLHKNLVRLLGFCLEEEEKLLVYEFLPNGSLDKILFDDNRRLELDWDERYKIVIGIAQGLLYLHQDSQIRIIHRDMKASNILLDQDMNPKISDFGLARIFNESEAQVNTIRLAGTYGYMAPEYTKHGHFSIKSDVFSFGILVLEIVAGRKNKGFRTSANLQSYAWEHWNNGTALQMVDPAIGDQWPTSEILKCIHVGLLCVQHDALTRPTMSEVLLLLNTYSVTFPIPSKPAYFLKSVQSESGYLENSSFIESDQSTTTRTSQLSVNYLTVSDVDPR